MTDTIKFERVELMAGLLDRIKMEIVIRPEGGQVRRFLMQIERELEYAAQRMNCQNVEEEKIQKVRDFFNQYSIGLSEAEFFDWLQSQIFMKCIVHNSPMPHQWKYIAQAVNKSFQKISDKASTVVHNVPITKGEVIT